MFLWIISILSLTVLFADHVEKLYVRMDFTYLLYIETLLVTLM